MCWQLQLQDARGVALEAALPQFVCAKFVRCVRAKI